MGRFCRELKGDHVEFIRRQHMLFVATARSDGGRINLSPKGYDCLAVIDRRSLLYLDYAGSGNETANHVAADGRITFMWCSFDAKPLILRAYTYGRNVAKQTDEYATLMARWFAKVDPACGRGLIVADVESVQTSCGFGVPLYDYTGERTEMAEWTAKQVAKGQLDDYIRQNAARSELKFPLQPRK
jgi:hypothetical protein